MDTNKKDKEVNENEKEADENDIFLEKSGIGLKPMHDGKLQVDADDVDPDVEIARKGRLDRDQEGKGGKSWKEAWFQFCQETSFSALKQVTEPQPFLFRRMFWLLLFVVGFIAFVIQVSYSISYYMSWPVSVDVKLSYNKTIEFPAVTICNENAFRVSASYEQGRYFLLSDMFTKGSKKQGKDISALNLTLDDIYLRAKHMKEDMIYHCEWNSEPCSADDFDMTLTDYGVCYTFNSARNGREVKRATQTGVHGGLHLQLNIEQYEYMPGPNDGAGVRLMVHEPHDIPLLQDHGLAVPNSMQALVALQVIKEATLPPPHGKCSDSTKLKYFSNYTMSSCLTDCKQQYLEEHCGCRDIYMPAHPGVPVCTLGAYSTCMVHALAEFHRGSAICPCPVTCSRTLYAPLVSYVSISNYDLDSLLENNKVTEKLRKRFLSAYEATQRVNLAIARKDRKLIQDFTNIVEKLDSSFKQILKNIVEAKEHLSETWKQMDARMSFHLKRGLLNVKYCLEHDFTRGWMVFEERVLTYVAANYNDVHLSFRRLVSWINESIPLDEQSRRMDAWLGMRNDIEGRLHLIRYARINVTTANNSYTTGERILTYESTLDRRYDETFVPHDLFGSKRQGYYYRALMKGLNESEEALQTLKDIGQRFIETGEFDEKEFFDAKNHYIKGNRAYNFQRFLFKDRIVLKPMEVLEGRITSFHGIQDNLVVKYENLHTLLNEVHTIIENTTALGWTQLKDVAAAATEYRINREKRKTDLALMVTNEEFHDFVHALRIELSTLRSRGRELRDSFKEFRNHYGKVWQTMLGEPTTQPFYKMLKADLDSFYANQNATYLFKVFADLLKKSESWLKKKDPADFVFLLNADILDIPLDEKLLKIQEEIQDMKIKCDVGGYMGDGDEIFFHKFEALQSRLAKSLEESQIDQKFYRDNFMRLEVYMRELSYETIIQQPAYDIPQLLSDIGGSMGLFIGGGTLSIVELMDVIGHNGARRALNR